MAGTGSRNVVRCSLLLLVGACSSSNPSPDGGAPPDAGPPSCASGCAAGLSCVTNADFPAGACSRACGGTGACPAGTVCSPLSTGSFCIQTCSVSSPCQDALTCQPTSKGNVCLAAAAPLAPGTSCAAPQILVGPTAGPSSDPGVCVTPRVASALPAADVQSLGVHQTGTQTSFTLPAGTVGFSLVSQAVVVASPSIDFQGFTLPNLPVPSPVRTPQGATLFDDSAAIPTDQTTMLLVNPTPSPYTAALTFPNSTAGLALALDGGLPAGTWSFGVNDYALECLSTPGCSGGTEGNTYDLSVLVKAGPLPGTGQMAVDVYLVSTSLQAGTAVTSPAVERFANRFAAFYAQAGVCVSAITFHDVPDWAKAKYASLSVDDADLPCGEFRQMFTLAQPGRTMALFLVDELVTTVSPGHGQSLVGLDGAIPGTATFNGTIAGGAAASGSDLTSVAGCVGPGFSAACGPDAVAYVSAHETGHFLGLFHPSESSGTLFDPLVDSPACVCSLCQSASTAATCGENPDGGEPAQVLPDVCSSPTQECGGADLLMFWLLTDSSVGNVTPEQSAVIRTNPLIAPP
jgi:hypothetical protein